MVGVGIGIGINDPSGRAMIDRGFSEVDLRMMLEKASGYRKNVVEGRWVIATKHQQRHWEVIVEPDDETNL